MIVNTKLNFVLVLVFITILSYDIAYSCQCTQKIPEIKNAFAASAAVFSGRVEEIVRFDAYDYVVKMHVDKAYKNIARQYVYLVSTSFPTECGLDFYIGQQYLIYAYLNNKNVMMAKQCGRSQILENIADKELKTLDKLHKDS